MVKHPNADICRLLLIAGFAAPVAGCVVVAGRAPGLLYAAAAFALVLAWGAARRRGALWSHGTARTTTMLELMDAGLVGGDGLCMGKVGERATHSLGRALGILLDSRVGSDVACRAVLSALYPRWQDEPWVRISDFVHLLTCAPAGAGKSIYTLVPNLLGYPGSCVVTDPKGELWRLTAAHRRSRLGHRVFLFDPFGICNAGSETFNPLDFIDANAFDFLDKCRDLANMLVVRSGEEREPHFNDMAEIVLTSFVGFVCACESDPRIRNLTTVRKLVSSRQAFTRATETMQKVQGFHEVVSRYGKMLQWLVDRELGSVMATVQRHTAWMDSPQVAACLSHTSFDPALLRTGRVTVYFVLPADKLVTLSALMRTWIGNTLRISTQGGASERNSVLFLLDEAGHLGHMQVLQDAVTLMRGYGIRLWFFFQSLGQLNECYGKHASVILDNLATQQYFGINSYDTAEAISKRIGEQTIIARTENGGGGQSWPTGPAPHGPQPGNRSRSWGWSEAPMARRLLKPEEIMVLPGDVSLVFHKNHPVIMTKLVAYFDAAESRKGSEHRRHGLVYQSVLTACAGACLGAISLLGTDDPRPMPAPGGGMPHSAFGKIQFGVSPPHSGLGAGGRAGAPPIGPLPPTGSIPGPKRPAERHALPPRRGVTRNAYYPQSWVPRLPGGNVSRWEFETSQGGVFPPVSAESPAFGPSPSRKSSRR